jgi:hypothetical protein
LPSFRPGILSSRPVLPSLLSFRLFRPLPFLGRDANKNEKQRSDADDLLRQLIKWFKKEFFKWVNKPPCAACGGKPKVY